MRLQIFCQPGEGDPAVNAARGAYAVASVGRPIKTRNAGQPGEVAVTIRAALRRTAVES